MTTLVTTISLALMTLRSHWRRLARPPELPLPPLEVHLCRVDKNGRGSLVSYTYKGHKVIFARGTYTKYLVNLRVEGKGSAN